MNRRFRCNQAFAALILWTGTAIASPAQTFTVLTSFLKSNKNYPAYVALAQGTDGNLYGTTLWGGNTKKACGLGCGTVFAVTPAGALTTAHKFGSTNGEGPLAGVILARDGSFYGTTDAEP